MKLQNEAVLVAYGRSAVCRARKGSLARVHPVDYAAETLRGVLAKIPALDPREISDVVVGCAIPEREQGNNMARLIVLRAGLPDIVCGQTINRFCSSGLQAIATCANAIMAGQEEIMVAGGVEDMSKTFGMDTSACDNPWLTGHVPGAYMPMGITAENVAERRGVTRPEMEELAAASHKKAAAAQKNGEFDDSIIPVHGFDGEGNPCMVTRDEGIRPGTTTEVLAGLKPSFRENGTVTAATSSQTSDGAAFAVLMSAGKAAELGIRPLAKFISFAACGCDAEVMGLGPIYAVPRVMKKSGLMLEQMDVIELNEAFAAQAIPCMRELGMDPAKVNPNGGAMALGHPLGATGAVLTVKALDYLRRYGGKYALVTMCIGGGMGAAGIFELL